jgi:hypothetical protein
VQEDTDQTGNYQVHTLTGKLVRVVKAVGDATTDVHELLLLPNGNYLLGAQVKVSGANTIPYGGSSANDTVTEAELQEVTPGGKLVWKWDSYDHIGLGQTPTRWWDQIRGPHLHNDVVHWNSVQPVGKKFMLISFRHLDAIYEINRHSGNIVWKLGGTQTPKSLTVRDDPLGSYPLAGQHDARIAPDGTITAFDDGTGFDNRAPRAVRYRVDPKTGTAHLVQAISDPNVPMAICCGDARVLPSGDWFIGWGGAANGVAGAYAPNGKPLFRLVTPGEFGYRANPVAPGALTAKKLRRAMNRMAG